MCNDIWGLGQGIEAILVLALRLNYASSRMLLICIFFSVWTLIYIYIM